MLSILVRAKNFFFFWLNMCHNLCDLAALRGNIKHVIQKKIVVSPNTDEMVLTLSQTSPGFYVSALQVF